MILFNKPVDIDDLPPDSKHQNTKNLSPEQMLRAVIICSACLVLAACQSETPQSTTQIQTNPEQENPIAIDSAVADLSNDYLQPPAEASLAIISEPGFLQLTWAPIPEQRQASIYKFDDVEGVEVLIAQSDDANMNTMKLPSSTHQRAWQREKFRVELCDSDDCISSPRVSITGLAEASVQRVSPSVFVQGEKFADSIAFNRNARLMAVSLPVQGVVDLYLRPDKQWVHTQRIPLGDTSLSSTRTITLGLSLSGDTLGALVTDAQGSSELKIMERFGEAWFETTSLELQSTSLENTNTSKAIISDTLSISEDSNLMYIGTDNQLFTTSRQTAGWTAPKPLRQDQDPYHPSPTAFAERFSNEAMLKAASANHTLSRLFTVHSFDQNVWLSVWEKTSDNVVTPEWTKTLAHVINGVNSQKDVLIHSNSGGDQIVLAGWELNNDVEHRPVLWRYDIPTGAGVEQTTSSELSVVDSLRFPLAAQGIAALRFSADDTLNNVVLGWQSTDIATSASVAALTTYQFSTTAMRWVPKLELPEVFPTFTKKSFVGSALLSPDGDSLVISIEAGESLAGENRVGELLTLQ